VVGLGFTYPSLRRDVRAEGNTHHLLLVLVLDIHLLKFLIGSLVGNMVLYLHVLRVLLVNRHLAVTHGSLVLDPVSVFLVTIVDLLGVVSV
jgi:hypothetical protein